MRGGSYGAPQSQLDTVAEVEHVAVVQQGSLAGSQAQRFLATHDQVANLFRTPTTADANHRRQTRRQAHMVWADVAKVAVP